jgi:hypothetical protein
LTFPHKLWQKRQKIRDERRLGADNHFSSHRDGNSGCRVGYRVSLNWKISFTQGLRPYSKKEKARQARRTLNLLTMRPQAGV